MHEVLIMLLNVILLALLIKKNSKLNIYLSMALSYTIVWILFLNVNPYDNKNENKFTTLSYIPAEYIPKMYLVKDVNLNKLNYPVIFKPIECSNVGKNVEVIRNINEATKYLEHKNINKVMAQDFIEYKNEVGILYERNIVSMVTKQSKNSNVMKSCYGDVNCEDITHLTTRKLNEVIVKISKQIPNFNFGRYDIKYKDLNSLLEGKNFYILEVNGVMGFDLRKSNLHYFAIPSTFYIECWFLSRILQGAKNILTLNGYNPISLIQMMAQTLINTIYCKDWEKMYSVSS